MINVIFKIEEQGPGQIAVGQEIDHVNPTDAEIFCLTELHDTVDKTMHQIAKKVGDATVLTMEGERRRKMIKDYMADNGENPRRFKDWPEPGK